MFSKRTITAMTRREERGKMDIVFELSKKEKASLD